MKKILRLLIIFLMFVCLFGCSLGGDKPNDNKQEENTNNENINNNENNNNEKQNGNESTLVEVKIPNLKNVTMSDAVKAYDLSYDKSQVEIKKKALIEIIKKAKTDDEINKA